MHKESQQKLFAPSQDGAAFLNGKAAEDESWAHHYVPESRKQGTQWNHTSFPVAIS
jgi:hypothetical protein